MNTLYVIVWGVVVLGGTSIVCGAVLAVAAKFFSVKEDPRVVELASALPGANCGGCGYAGCWEYARAIVLEGVAPGVCGPGGPETAAKLAKLLGVAIEQQERRVAVVLCGGDNSVSKRSSIYNGIADCVSAELAGGGGKACRYGCIGFGTCARVCPVNAIEITTGKLAVVDPDVCIGCGKCVAACPRRLVKLTPESRFIHILCSSKDKGPTVKKACDVGCIACARCVKTANSEAIKMDGNLAVIDYAVPLAAEEVIEKCPMKTIVKRSGIIGRKLTPQPG